MSKSKGSKVKRGKAKEKRVIGNPKKALIRVLGASRKIFLGLGNLPTAFTFSLDTFLDSRNVSRKIIFY